MIQQPWSNSKIMRDESPDSSQPFKGASTQQTVTKDSEIELIMKYRPATPPNNQFDPMLEEVHLGFPMKESTAGDGTAFQDLVTDCVDKVPTPTRQDPMVWELETQQSAEQEPMGFIPADAMQQEVVTATEIPSQHDALTPHSQEESNQQQQQQSSEINILQMMTKTVPPPVMATPIMRKKPTKELNEQTEEEAALRRSGRLAVKQTQSGHKTSQELAQEVLAKKLGVLESNKDLNEEVKNKLIKLFEEPLPKEAMEAMEDLLKAMNIGAGPPKKGNTTAVKGVAKKGK